MITDNDNVVKQGRESFVKQDWTGAYDKLSGADRRLNLKGPDLEILALSAYLTGRDSESDVYQTRAHHEFLKRGDKEQAVRCAFWLGMRLLFRGEKARGGGWISRAASLLNEIKSDCVWKGYMNLPVALRLMAEGDPGKSHEMFTKALASGEHFGDSDLIALGMLGQGQALIRMGRSKDGVTYLDQSMVSVEAGEVSPMVAGIIYCAVIDACQEIFDLRRAREWTEALNRWCHSHPDLIPFRGQCLVYRAELLQLQGSWETAMAEVRKACELLERPPGEPAAGEAYYCKGELHRVKGEIAEAEEAYREASRHGRIPHPGLARLRLAQGQKSAARSAIRHLINESQHQARHTAVLFAWVDIMLDSGEIDEARKAADELAGKAVPFDSPYLRAIACHSNGAVLLAERVYLKALHTLQEACSLWKELGVTYEAARTRTLIGQTFRKLGDTDTAAMEFGSARELFKNIGAAAELSRLELLTRHSTAESDRTGSHGLTPRQLDVLRHIAAGDSNKIIAGRLFISERTVERHVSDIFSRLNVPSRAAAAAFAHRHKLI